jgi:hypothetical protein
MAAEGRSTGCATMVSSSHVDIVDSKNSANLFEMIPAQGTSMPQWELLLTQSA